MRLTDVILISVLLGFFSSVLGEAFVQMKKMDLVIEKYYLQTESLEFISQSFCNVCSGKGFKDFYEWGKSCSAMWNLERIEWETAGDDLYRGFWCGPFGNGEVYCKKQERKDES